MAHSGTICLLLLAALLLPCEASGCMVGLETAGRTYPKGDIYLEANQKLKITCILNSANETHAKNIVFLNGSQEIDHKFVHVLNDTAAELIIPNMTLTRESTYYCMIKPKPNATVPVCLNKVFVGLKPQEVQNFTCVSQNWEELICKWDVVDHRVATFYRISWTLSGRGGRKKPAHCPDMSDRLYNNCTWSAMTDPIYRTPHPYYEFHLTGSNELGNVTFPPIKFHHYAHVIPDPPECMAVFDIQTNSAVMNWSRPFKLGTFPRGIINKAEYRHEWMEKDKWIVVNTTRLDKKKPFWLLTLKDLPYAYTNYTFRAFLKSGDANDDSYSKPTYQSFTTLPKKPSASPEVDIGSYETSAVSERNERDVFVYWKAIPESMHNGPNFSYCVIVNNTDINITNIDKSLSHVKIKNLSSGPHTILIYAANSLGMSDTPSVIFVSPYTYKMQVPTTFTKIDFENGQYELSWGESAVSIYPGSEKIVNYTIFWCNSLKDRPHQCTGTMDWIHVPAGVYTYNVTVPDKQVYQFAISSNGYNTSSGLTWTACTAAHNKLIVGMKDIWLNRILSDRLDIGWRLECSNRFGQVEGYNIYFCPVISKEVLSCKEPPQKRHVFGDANTYRGTLSMLKPYTLYMFNITVMSRGGEGAPSAPFLVPTLEAAPSSPTNLRATNVTNSSVHISWNEPEQKNGKLNVYMIQYGNNVTNISETLTEYTLEKLPSFTTMNISVRACTTDCSVASNIVKITTLIGNPGKIDRLDFERQLNSTDVRVYWEPPLFKGGPRTHYELSIDKVDIYNQTQYIQITQSATTIITPDAACSKEGNDVTIKYRVRAVNRNERNESLPGPWSDTKVDYCSHAGAPIWVAMGIVFLLVLFTSCVLYKFGRCVYKGVDSMRKIDVDLPTGLDPALMRPPVEQGEPLNADIEDSEMLLNTAGRHGRNPSGDSSGCSSAEREESMSSLTSTRQISTDSGTEADQNEIGTGDVQVELKRGEELNNLQYTMIPPGESMEMFSYSQQPQQYLKVGQPDSEEPSAPYIMLGEQQPEQAPLQTNKNGYVTVAQVEQGIAARGQAVRQNSISTADATPSSSEASTAASSASASPTLPTAAAQNGYSRVGVTEPPQPPAQCKGYVSLGDVPDLLKKQVIPVESEQQ